MMMQPIGAADAAARLVRGLLADAAAHALRPELVSIEGQRWASATFEGTRHRLVLEAAPGEAWDRWLAGLPETEFALRRHIVAELAVERVEPVMDRVRAHLTVLTLADD